MIPTGAFTLAPLPRIVFGPGRIAELPGIISAMGKRVLLVTGGRSFRATPHWKTLLDALRYSGVSVDDMAVTGEPSPELVDTAVSAFRGKGVAVVVGIGGGSALDAAKAIAGLLVPGNSVLDHLEGVGREIPYIGPETPFVAVPTTAGTGSETTKNAVLSRVGADGYKKSFRDDRLLARVAVVDPELLASCPLEVMAANGMDALTQLLESYVSINASVLTDALAWSGMERVRDGFLAACRGGASAEANLGRAAMAYASMLSGITLAHAGLGSVHGLASPLGAFFPIPHGVVCGTLVASATEVNIKALKERAPDAAALKKYAAVGRLLSGRNAPDDAAARAALVETLAEWTRALALPNLSALGVQGMDVTRIVNNARGSSMKTNPLVLTDGEIGSILRNRL